MTTIIRISQIKEASLQGTVTGRVSELSGYSKPRGSLSTHNDWERAFVENAGRNEVTQRATGIFEQVRELFRYKRKELSFANPGTAASINGPEFDVHLSLAQDPEDAERFVLRTEVRSFRNPTVIEDPRFLSIFSKYCHQVVLELETPLDIETTIDEIEEIEADNLHLDYAPDCTHFTLRLHGIVLSANAERMVFSLDGLGDLKLLLESSRKLIEQLSRQRVSLGISTQVTES
ncbi:MAG: hypothetical protein ABL921_10955 [Pirellula sp.]